MQKAMLGSFIGISRLLLDTAKMIFPENEEIGAAARTADKAGNTYNLLTQHSINEQANRTLVAPILGIDKTILHASYTSTVMQVCMTRDIHAVLNHIAIKNASAMGIKIDEIIGGVQPRRAGLVSLQGCEAITQNGPNPNKPGKSNASETSTADSDDTIVSINGKSYSELTEYSPLAIGRVVVATITGPTGAKLELPLTFRETPMPMSAAQLQNVFSAAKPEEGFFARLSMWLDTSEISGAEFFSGSDINKEKFRVRNEDMTGYFEEMARRDRVNKAQAIRTGVVSMNTMANTFIMSSDTMKQIELQIGRSFLRTSHMGQIFKAVKASRIVICDDRNSVFHFITNGDDIIETFTLKELESKAKKADSADTLEALTRLLAGK